MIFEGLIKKVSMCARGMMLLFVVPAIISSAGAQEVKLSVSASVQKIYAGDSFNLSVVLDGTLADNVMPEFDITDGYSISNPRFSRQSSGGFIVNGVQMGTPVMRTSWQYAVTPHEAGTFSMGTVKVTANGKTHTAEIPIVEVIGPGEQPYVAINIYSDKDNVLVEEQFEVTVEILVRKLSDPRYESLNPASPGENYTPPGLEIPFLTKEVGNSKFNGDIAGFLEKYSTPGGNEGTFRINNFSVRKRTGGGSLFPGFGSMFDDLDSLMAEPVPAHFYFPRENAELDGKPAWKYTLKLPYESVEEGNSNFRPVRFKGTVFTDTDGGEPVPVSVFASSSSVLLKVVPPPSAGRPDSFIGSHGTFLNVHANLDAQRCSVGDPIVLTIEVEGDQTLSNMHAPDIFKNPVLAERFRQYGDVSEEIGRSGGRFIYKIRPQISGTIEVPPVEISFYNREKKEYETVETSPVPLRVNPSQELDPDLIFGRSAETRSINLSFGKTEAPSGITVVSNGTMVMNSIENLAISRNLAIPPLIYFVFYGIKSLWQRRKRMNLAFRKRSASTRTIRRISSARSPQNIMEGVGILLRDKFGVTGSGFTPEDIRRELEKAGADKQSVGELYSLLQDTFNAGFSPDVDPSKVARKNRKRIAEILTSLKLSLIFLLLLFPAHDVFASNVGKEFTWRQANSMASSARSEEDFRDAALKYRQLLDEGVLDVPLLYNYGTMLMLAGCPNESVDALKRAEALGGTSPEIENNLAIALRMARHLEMKKEHNMFQEILPDERITLPWYRIPLFWHYWTPVSLRVEVLYSLWWFFWIGLLVTRAGLRRTGRVFAVSALVGIAVFGSSVLASRHVLKAPLPSLRKIETGSAAEGQQK